MAKTTKKTQDTQTPSQQMSFEDKIARLEEISKIMRGEGLATLSLEEGLALFQEGMKLGSEVQDYLKNVEQKVEFIKEGKEVVLTPTPTAPAMSKAAPKAEAVAAKPGTKAATPKVAPVDNTELQSDILNMFKEDWDEEDEEIEWEDEIDIDEEPSLF